LKIKLLRTAKYIVLAVIAFYSLNCSRNIEKQKYADEYSKVVYELIKRGEITKKGQDAIIAYRKSNFMDIDNAEIARNYFLQGIVLDSLSLTHLTKIEMPDSAANEISELLIKGITAISRGNSIYASNYSNAKVLNLEQRKESFLNVKPALVFTADGLNNTVLSLEKFKMYANSNDLKVNDKFEEWFKHFKEERDHLKSFIKE